MKETKRLLAVLLLVVMAMSLLSGCKKGETEESVEVVEESSEVQNKTMNLKEESSEESVEESSEETSEEVVEEPVVELKYTNPLTGEACAEDYTDKRPYVFMCNNLDVALPQRGISQAEMIIELMEEGQITRMMAFFYDPSDVGDIGSIRSARAYNVDTALGYDAILVHCGGSEEALYMIEDYGLADVCQIHGTCWGDTFYRDPSRQYYGTEHSLFAVGENVVDYVENGSGYRLEHEDDFDGTYGMIFSEDAVKQCTETATDIDVIYAGGKTSSFEYDAETNLYTMYEYGVEYNDDGVHDVRFSNVVMIYAYTYTQADGCHLTIELTEGEGYFFTGGKVVPILWYKDGAYDCYHYTLEDGTPLEFSVGKTFVCVNQTGYAYNGTVEWD